MIILDCIIATMLMISIVYSWQLNKKIVLFQNSKKEFYQLVNSLDNTIQKAEIAIDELKTLNKNALSNLSLKIDKANYLSDDLAFMTDRASLLADKLDQMINQARHFEQLNIIDTQLNNKRYRQSEPVEKLLNNSYFENINDFTSFESKEPTNKNAIESLLAKISAVKNYRKDKIDT